MQLRLEPASATLLPALGAAPATQRMHVINSMHGAKAVAMRLRLAYTLGGRQVLEQAEVSNFPEGL
jgi:AP-1 complex subunit gamma-1